MKIAIVGCGAMGSIYAALFSDSGHDVFAIDTNVAHVNAINEYGLKVIGASGDRTIRLAAFTKAPQIKVDLVIVAVKLHTSIQQFQRYALLSTLSLYW